ncbi:MAG: DUF3305 domain-containing protein [Gemmobacter sp.]
MPVEALRIGVVAELRAPVTRWGGPVLRPVAVLPEEPATPPRSRLPGGAQWYLGAPALVLHSGDAGHLRDNLASGRPTVWVALRGVAPDSAEIVAVTADPYEGEGLAGDPDLTVEAVPMPAAIAARVADFAKRHHVEIPFRKRRRSPASDPDLRAPRILRPDQKWGHKEGGDG